MRIFFFAATVLIVSAVAFTGSEALAGSGSSSKSSPDREKSIADTNAIYDWQPLFNANEGGKSECQGGYVEPPRVPIDTTQPQRNFIYGSADRYIYAPEGTSELQGNVILQQDDHQFQSNRALYNHTKNQILLDGDLTIRQKGMLFRAESGIFDVNQQQYHLENSLYVIHGPGLRGKARQIDREADKKIYLTEASFTTCPPDSNDWSFTSSNLTLNPHKGWGTAKNSVFSIKKIPVAYLPYFNFPIDGRRKTGFLYPTLTDLGETDISLPFYWNIAPQYDATFTPRFIDQRGVLFSSRFRYLSKEKGKGDFIFEEIEKDKLFGSKTRSHGIWRHQLESDHLHVQTDLHYLSDNHFFTDFEDDVQLISQTYVDRNAQVYWNDDQYQAGMILQSYQVIDSTVAKENFPYRRLPESFLHLEQDIFRRFTWENLWQHVYFAQPEALNVPYAHRLHWQSSVSYPWYQIWGFAEPKVTFHASEYYFSGQHTGYNDSERRVVPSFSFNTGLFFDRHVPEKNYTQTLEPRLFFSYVPFREQNNLPNFESSEFTFGMEQLMRENRFSGFDRISDAKQVSLMLWSRFINQKTHEEKALFRAGEAFYLDNPRVQLNPTQTTHYSNSPFLLESQISWPLHTLSRMALEYNHREDLIQSGWAEMQYHQNLNRILNIGYRYRRETIETDPIDQVQFSFSQSLHPKWRLLSAIQYDRKSQASLGNIVGLNYESCCWLLQMLYTQNVRPESELDAADTSYKYAFIIEFVFKGLGNLGNKSERIFTNRIPGYDKFHYFDQ